MRSWTDCYSRLMLVILWVALVGEQRLFGDAAVPPQVLEPQTPPEAWNVIRLATRNVEILLKESRLMEVPLQISLCSPALRTLARNPKELSALPQIEERSTRAFVSVNAVARAAQENNPAGASAALASLRGILSEMEAFFDPATVAADIYLCPMHADCLSPDPKTTCAKCGMDLLVRRIPYSFIYTAPGEPSIRLTAKPEGPVIPGKALSVTVHIEKPDGKPVGYGDLLLMHSEFIHLLIEEPGLSDYHHEHPKATAVPGDFRFTFTPRKSGPYRIWADLVPASTGIQELPFADLPGPSVERPQDTADRYIAQAGGYQFSLLFAEGNHVPVKAGQARRMTITVSKIGGEPVQNLEPVMNAFAHLVGFYEDYRTVVHLHPGGGEITNPELRGGPSLGFMFFPPKAGFIRLYCQVLIDGEMIFAPFNVNVIP